MKNIIVLGSGGHAKVLIDALQLNGHPIFGITDPNKTGTFFNIPILGDDSMIQTFSPNDVMLVNGIGSIGNNHLRKKVFLTFKALGYSFLTVIHPSAIISKYAKLGEGVQIMAGSIIQTDSIIADNTIINTKTSIDHDCKIGDHTHIAPGCTLSGNVRVGDDVHIGTGASIIQNLSIGNRTIVGAGSVVIRNIAPDQKVYGVPAKEVSI